MSTKGTSSAGGLVGTTSGSSRGVCGAGAEALGRRRGGIRSSMGAWRGEAAPGVGVPGGDLCIETRSSEVGETSLRTGVCGRLLGEVVKGRSTAAEGGRLKEPALRGERSVRDPSDVDRDGAPGGFGFDTDSGCAFHRYAEEERAGDLGRISPRGLGGMWLAVTRLPSPYASELCAPPAICACGMPIMPCPNIPPALCAPNMPPPVLAPKRPPPPPCPKRPPPALCPNMPPPALCPKRPPPVLAPNSPPPVFCPKRPPPALAPKRPPPVFAPNRPPPLGLAPKRPPPVF
mmetsp:Transcript_44912/g.128273  ORF Transcript_44912/g.128273 Transcript_44912/m.128273 type:complete len:289 (+) Transcript_44912:702-1568(+)